MSKFPIHKNLNTSFVDMSALVRHLRNLGFVGALQLELSSYEAEIEFTAGGSINAREQDHIADRLSFGDGALQRIMIRSREPGGLINVYESATANSRGRIFVDKAIAAGARKMAGEQPAKPVEANGNRMNIFAAAAAKAEAPIPKPGVPFDPEAAQNWSELLALVSEVMQTLDSTLAKGNINFADAFRNACGFVSLEYGFLDPDSDVFSYSDGYISIRQRIGTRDLVSGITAALARIMQRLGEDPYFGNVYHQAMHRLRVLANQRKLQFETFGLGTELQKITGI